MVKKASKKKKSSPDWAFAPFNRFLEKTKQLTHVVRLSCVGISTLQGVPMLIEALTKIEEENSPEGAELKRARQDAALARDEVKSGFPILHAWAVVGIWTLYESTIRTFVAEWLQHKRSAWRVEAVKRLKIRLGDYESIPKAQRYRYVVELLEKKLAVGLKSGVSRSEAMLDPFGLSGPLPEKLKRGIHELSQVRNLIIHNGSKVDRRFVEACPWLKTKIGDDFHVSTDEFLKYSYFMSAYVTILVCRVGEYFGLDMSASYQDTVERLERSAQ